MYLVSVGRNKEIIEKQYLRDYVYFGSPQFFFFRGENDRRTEYCIRSTVFRETISY